MSGVLAVPYPAAGYNCRQLDALQIGMDALEVEDKNIFKLSTEDLG